MPSAGFGPPRLRQLLCTETCEERWSIVSHTPFSIAYNPTSLLSSVSFMGTDILANGSGEPEQPDKALVHDGLRSRGRPAPITFEIVHAKKAVFRARFVAARPRFTASAGERAGGR